MTYTEWQKIASVGDCARCGAHQVPVLLQPVQNFTHNTLCYLCAEAGNLMYMAAWTLLLNALKPMPKPKKPRQPKKITVEPMTPRKDRR